MQVSHKGQRKGAPILSLPLALTSPFLCCPCVTSRDSPKWRACSQVKHQLFTVLPQTSKMQPLALTGVGRGVGIIIHYYFVMKICAKWGWRKSVWTQLMASQPQLGSWKKEKNDAGCDKDNHVHPWVPMSSPYTLALVAIHACMCTVICKNTDYLFFINRNVNKPWL